jgi:hypothetical protein
VLRRADGIAGGASGKIRQGAPEPIGEQALDFSKAMLGNQRDFTMSFGVAAAVLIGLMSLNAPQLAATLIEADSDTVAKRAVDPKLPTKIHPLFIKVGCLTRDYRASGAKSLDDLKVSKEDGDRTDYLMLTIGKNWKYDFLSASPRVFVKGLQEAVSKEQDRLGAAKENRGKFNVRCVIKLLVLEGHTGAGVGGSPANFEMFGKNGVKVGGLTTEQIETLQKLMADDATIYWVACLSMTKNGTAQALQKVLKKNGGVFAGFKDSCWASHSFPNELSIDDSYPAAVRIPRGAEPKELERLFRLCGLPVKGDSEYYFDDRFPGRNLRPWCYWSWFPENLRIPLVLGPVIELPPAKK